MSGEKQIKRRLGRRRRAILEYFKEHPEPVSASDLTKVFGITSASVFSALNGLRDMGHIRRVARGLWGAVPPEEKEVYQPPPIPPGTPTHHRTRPAASNEGMDVLLLCIHCRASVDRENPGRYEWDEAPEYTVCVSPGCEKRADAIGRDLHPYKLVPSPVADDWELKDLVPPIPIGDKQDKYNEQFQDLNLVDSLSALNKWLAVYSGDTNNPVVVEIVLAHEHMKRALEFMDDRLKEMIKENLKPIGTVVVKEGDATTNNGTRTCVHGQTVHLSRGTGISLYLHEDKTWCRKPFRHLEGNSSIQQASGGV